MGSLRTVGSGLVLAALITMGLAAIVGQGDAARPGPGTERPATHAASAPGYVAVPPSAAPADANPGGGPAASPERSSPVPAAPSDRAADAAAGTGQLLAVLRAQALARIDYPWQQRLPGWEIDFVGPRAGFLGATITDERRIEIYVDGRRSVEELAFTLAHELGHAVDLTLLDGEDRDRWLAARGAEGKAWWAANAESDYGVGAGDWAEAFAVWQLGGRGYSSLAGPPTDVQLSLVARMAAGG